MSTIQVTKQESTSKLLAEIKAHTDGNGFAKLIEDEPTFTWLAFAAKMYRRSHSINTITTFARHIGTLRDYCQSRNISLQDFTKTGDLIYNQLDDFVTYCDAERDFMPRTTANAFLSACQLLRFVGVELSRDKLKAISMPRAKRLADEYPDNEVIIKTINHASPTIRAFILTMCDTGLEPIDCSQLKLADIRFNESPVRGTVFRQKTGELIEFFISDTTAALIKQIAKSEYVFTTHYDSHTVKYMRNRYNNALAKAGFGSLVYKDRNNAYGKIEKIDGHKYGKYHLKTLKKRWFTLAISSGVPEYVAQAMLGRKQYLDQYLKLPLEKRQDFARKILAHVSPYNSGKNATKTASAVSEMLGVDVDEKKLEMIKALMSGLLAQPQDKLSQILGALGNKGDQ